MIPYFQITSFQLGPLTIYVWGLFVALGFLVALLISRRIVERGGGNGEHVMNLGAWVIFASFVGARIVHAMLYQPAVYLEDPWEILRVWNGGFSSFGGFAGGAIAALAYIRRHRLPIAQYANAILFSIPWGWAIGRIGCFLIHDHPGTLTNSVFGVKYPDGARFDLGFFEMVNGISTGVVMLVVRRLTHRDGIAASAGVAWYAIVRFFSDFLRSNDLLGSDVRYAGLTPAQYGAIILLAVTMLILVNSKSQIPNHKQYPISKF